MNDEQMWWTEGFKEGYRAGLSDQRPPAEPSLGLASTRELLCEITTRMRVNDFESSPVMTELGATCNKACTRLSAEVLNYRMVDS